VSFRIRLLVSLNHRFIIERTKEVVDVFFSLSNVPARDPESSYHRLLCFHTSPAFLRRPPESLAYHRSCNPWRTTKVLISGSSSIWSPLYGVEIINHYTPISVALTRRTYEHITTSQHPRGLFFLAIPYIALTRMCVLLTFQCFAEVLHRVVGVFAGATRLYGLTTVH